jgi:enoyl-[acyl-carrier protein] reductase II
MVTKESDSHIHVKKAVVKGEDACTLSLPKDIMLARDLSNAFTAEYLAKKSGGVSTAELQKFLSEHSQYHAQHLGDAENAEICCGQVAGLINTIERAEDVIKEIVNDIINQFDALKQKITFMI